MNKLCADDAARSPDFLSDDSFFFTSPWKSIVTQGCFTTLDTPAWQGHDLQSELQKKVRSAFVEARESGIDKPLLVGAIPFDTRQPSALFIPQRCKYFSRQQRVTMAEQAMAGPLPVITGRQVIPEKDAFMAMVAQAAEATAQPELDKVVLSRLFDITTSTPVKAYAMMDRLMALNPTSYHFHVPLADGGTLLGASPELLLRKTGNHFSSLPLAGSARRDDSSDDADRAVGERLMYSQKDRYEHRLVTEAMQAVLQSRSHSLMVPEKPDLITTSALWHLATPIEGEVSSSTENALSLACLLHPTPALSGYPHELARQWIERLEPFDRQLFGGIVGWCDEQGDGEWVVTIRCATLAGNRIRLFAGAGIVPASSPEAEWHETGVKLSTMMKVFGLQ
ncbi:isochorismate synthase [Erwinia endophytica]|uniref:isochorismate synthase n=1 Tax=Erwinia endophytica TaxID=1563158 RepID=UPI001265FFA8|nr:isochorismate synthase [Erwinia endophytica]KAB8307394.1 isochorismate synthase [Erwinia endophytica]